MLSSPEVENSEVAKPEAGVYPKEDLDVTLDHVTCSSTRFSVTDTSVSSSITVIGPVRSTSPVSSIKSEYLRKLLSRRHVVNDSGETSPCKSSASLNTATSSTGSTESHKNIVIDYKKRLGGKLDVAGILSDVRRKYSSNKVTSKKPSRNTKLSDEIGTILQNISSERITTCSKTTDREIGNLEEQLSKVTIEAKLSKVKVDTKVDTAEPIEIEAIANVNEESKSTEINHIDSSRVSNTDVVTKKAIKIKPYPKIRYTAPTRIPAPTKKTSAAPRRHPREYPQGTFCKVNDCSDLDLSVKQKHTTLANVNRRSKFDFIDYEVTLPVNQRSQIPVTLIRRNAYSHEDRLQGFEAPTYVLVNTPLSAKNIVEYREFSRIDIGPTICSYAPIVEALFPVLGSFVKVGGVTILSDVGDVQLAMYMLEAASSIRLQRVMAANGVARNKQIRRINYGLVVNYLGLLTDAAATLKKFEGQLTHYYEKLTLPCCADNEESAGDAHKNQAGLMVCPNRVILTTFSECRITCRCRTCDRIGKCACVDVYKRG